MSVVFCPNYRFCLRHECHQHGRCMHASIVWQSNNTGDEPPEYVNRWLAQRERREGSRDE